MSQAGYTPIQLYYSTTVAAVPVNTNLADGELAINITDGKLYYKDNGGTVRLLASNATSAPVLSFSAGTTGFTPSTATSGAITLAGTLATTNGGTGLTSFTSGGVVYASSTSALATGSALSFDGTKLTVIGSAPNQTNFVVTATGSDLFKIQPQAPGTGVYLQSSDYAQTVYAPMGFYGTSYQFNVGNVGIGVTPSVFTSTIKALQIGPTSVFRAGDTAYTQATFVASNARQETAVDYYIANGFATQYTQQGGAHIWATAVSGTAGNAIAFSQKMFLDVNGNLGIGTTSPATTLNVSGATGQTIMISNTSTSLSTGGSMGNLDFAAGTANTTNARVSGLVVGTSEAGGDLVVETRPDGGSLSERLRIASTGAFGLSGANYGTSGQVLTSGGSGAAPTWTTVGGGGGSAATPTALGTVYGNTSNSTGVTAGGYQALNVNTATNVTAFGATAGKANTSGLIDAFGSGAGESNTTGKISAFGYAVGYANTTGAGNSAFGGYDGVVNPTFRFNTTGNYNSAFGHGALAANTTASGSTAVGYAALDANTTGTENTAVGFNALGATTTGIYNVGVGAYALALQTTGTNNVGIGYGALVANTTASNNTAAGHYALQANTTGATNTAVGGLSLYTNTTGDSNTAAGYGSLQSNTTGLTNVAVGMQALNSNTTASGNTAVGYRAGFTNTTNTNLTAVGKEALLNSTGADNNAFGQSVLRSNTTGYSNSAFGGAGNFVAPAMTANTTGYNNSAFGNGALASNTTAANNVAVGHTALYNNSTGGSHVAVGQGALQANTTASGNTAIGYETAYTNTTGVQITALGHQAAKAGTTANYITAIGYAALLTNTTGSDNVAVGASAMELNTTGGDNTAVGDAALYANTTGAQNVSVGRNAGNSITTGSQNVCVGFDTDASAAGGLGQITIGYGLTGQGNYHVTMGTSSSKIYVNYTSTGTWTQTSDATLKNVIGQETLGLSFINRLNPVTFTWKSQTDLPVTHPHYSTANKKNTTTVMHGLLAQDVKAAMDAEGCATFNGWDQGPDGVQAVSREMFVTPLIKAIQELSAQVESLKARLDAANL